MNAARIRLFRRLFALAALALTVSPLRAAETPSTGPTVPAAGFRFALTGDSIINRRISVFQATGFPALIQRIRSADGAFTNLETLIHNFEFPGEAISGGTYMGSPPFITEELKWMGFNLLGTANNHTFDFGVEGMRSNLRHLQAAGLTYAGTGENLARARAPAYLDTPKGRVAIISCSSTFSPASIAGPQRPDLPGRPGLNALRFTTTYVVDAATFQSIDALRKLTVAGGDASPAPVPKPGAKLQFLSTRFEAGARNAVRTAPFPADLEGITAAVRDARQQADWVIVSIHCHEGAPGHIEVPPEFLVTFAHAVIDAGADLLVGHGPHLIRAIEVYKNKPIFYSMGNFIFENDLVLWQPQENYDSVGLPLTALPGDFFSKRAEGNTTTTNRLFWESMMAEPTFDSARHLVSIKLYPLELGFQKPRPDRGRPYPASDEASRRIIARLNDLSAPFGVSAALDHGVGVVKWQN